MDGLHKSNLTTNELLILQSELRHVEKSLGLAYLMLLGGHLGLHRFYLKRFATGAIQLALFIIAALGYLATIVFSADFETFSPLLLIFAILFFAIPGLALFIWIIVDLFLLGGMVREWNEQAEQRIIAKIVAIRENKPSLEQ